jgi:hypothetical protein
MDLFFLQRALMSALRLILGSLEFTAYIASTLSSMPKLTLWVVLSLLVPIFLFVFQKLWDSSLGYRQIVIFFLIFNISIGFAAIWAEALPVGKAISCEVSLGDGRLAKVVEYKEIGWRPGAVFFLGEYKEESSDWKQASYVEIIDPNKLGSISDPCDDIRSIFPDL